MPQTYKICSECSVEGHLWHECREKNKTCLNCGENHRTLAMKCSKRRDIVKAKRLAMSEKQKMTFAGITKQNVQQHMPAFEMSQVTKEDLLKIYICVAHAQSKDQENPGT